MIDYSISREEALVRAIRADELLWSSGEDEPQPPSRARPRCGGRFEGRRGVSPEQLADKPGALISDVERMAGRAG